MRAVIMIPARFGSTRLPGKPLALVKGRSVLHRLWSIAKSVNHIEEVYIATDDERIVLHAQSFGATVMMTPQTCQNGTERVWAAVEALSVKPDIILNLQGDAVLTPPWVIQDLLTTMLHEPTTLFATIATPLQWIDYEKMRAAKMRGEVGGTTVVFDKTSHALYFSKSLIPFLRNKTLDPLPIYRHIGLYAYRYATLKTYVNLPPTVLEQAEGLEPLRALENNIRIKVVPVDYRGRTHWAIDCLADIVEAERLIDQEGELISWN